MFTCPARECAGNVTSTVVGRFTEFYCGDCSHRWDEVVDLREDAGWWQETGLENADIHDEFMRREP